MYYDAIQFKDRPTKVTFNKKVCAVTIERRQFPDRCFLTRNQQHDRDEWWNKDVDTPLRQRHIDRDDDLLDFIWGYEHPKLSRSTFRAKIDYMSADVTTWKRWDQLDVHMHFFEEAMQADQRKMRAPAARTKIISLFKICF
jgi:hypothetical protein